MINLDSGACCAKYCLFFNVTLINRQIDIAIQTVSIVKMLVAETVIEPK